MAEPWRSIEQWGIISRIAKRFVAGERPEDAIRVVSQLNERGIKATLNILGEKVVSRKGAVEARDSYIELLRTIKDSAKDSHVSLKLTQLGLDIDYKFCLENVGRVVDKALNLDNFVRIDMEGSAYTQRTLEIFYKLKEAYNNVGVVIQSYLYRSIKDIEKLIRIRARVRLCKGAYREPKDVAYRDKKNVEKNFIMLMKILLENGNYPAIATHNDKLIRVTKLFAKEKNITEDRYEFQMLYGIREGLQKKLAEEGYNVRVYVPFGTHWLPYFIRRLRERKENVLFLIKNIFRE